MGGLKSSDIQIYVSLILLLKSLLFSNDTVIDYYLFFVFIKGEQLIPFKYKILSVGYHIASRSIIIVNQ